MERNQRDPLHALEHELVGERAHALSRIGSRMERALAELRAFDEAPVEGVAREELVAAAAEWVWFYVVQREVLGFYRHEDALRQYGVPPEVKLRMGPRRR
ncbi:MAG TPA: DUF6665 family protein [Kofleriaceae bacterium]|nr:DUF6665 family protein [Kofleriaceae bacterium]